jgi:hypothetical protein
MVLCRVQAFWLDDNVLALWLVEKISLTLCTLIFHSHMKSALSTYIVLLSIEPSEANFLVALQTVMAMLVSHKQKISH